MTAQDIASVVRPGDVLAGKYRIERVLGAGGMGVVVAAHHLQLDTRVAIKFLLPAAVSKPEALARFEREARAAVKIQSEHVARVIDVGRLETGAPYMVMEFLEGADLSVRLEKEGPVPFAEAADFILQACEAVVEAHALGIIHRDLKPANLFCVRRTDGLLSIKVLDFGISKSTTMAGTGSDMTQTQAMLGSPFYMSPEQMHSSRSVDARTDIWSLGVILFQLITGRVPFESESLPELVLKVVQQPTPSMRALRPEVPAGFDQVVFRCLEKDRERRYAHIGELAMALVPFAPARSQASAERIVRVIQTSGLAAVSKVAAAPARTSLMAPLADSKRGAQLPGSGSSPSPPITPSPSGPSAQARGEQMGMTNNSWGGTSSGQHAMPPAAPRRPGNAAVVAAIGGILAFAVVCGLAYLGKRAWDANARTAHTVPSADVSVASNAPTVATPPTPSAAAEPIPTPAATVTEPPPVVHDASASDAAAAPVVTNHPFVPVTPPPTAKPNCDSKYYYDEKGNRAFKKECL